MLFPQGMFRIGVAFHAFGAIRFQMLQEVDLVRLKKDLVRRGRCRLADDQTAAGQVNVSFTTSIHQLEQLVPRDEIAFCN